ncbi:hypothetical protein [Spirosoma luteum]|uniref:hypothetical protein n=1 Tax=Spirosoma luteum TaxID=431553 RepID=UPI000375F77F|nr:hypothetical protein [Spirosoma luteum]
MDNELKVEGNENVSFQDISNSNITVIINKSADYKRLLDELSSLEEHLTDLNPEKADKINQLKNRIINKNAEIERFEQDVISLAEAFSKININTSRLIKAKEYFNEGKFKEANTILKLTEIDKDQNLLLTAKSKKEIELEGLSKQLIDNSNEYYIKAKALIINSYLSNSFGEIFNLFKRSIKSH